MPPEMKTAYEAALRAGVPAPARLELPEWLRSAPPYRIALIPNGEILVYGPLGAWKPNWHELPKEERVPSGKTWYRYSAAGEVLGQWQEGTGSILGLWNPQADALLLSGKSQGYEVSENAGFVVWPRPAPGGGEVVAAWDYDGTPVDFSQPLTRPGHLFKYYQWEQVAHMLEVQE
jgi:hypothetical protein